MRASMLAKPCASRVSITYTDQHEALVRRLYLLAVSQNLLKRTQRISQAFLYESLARNPLFRAVRAVRPSPLDTSERNPVKLPWLIRRSTTGVFIATFIAANAVSQLSVPPSAAHHLLLEQVARACCPHNISDCFGLRPRSLPRGTHGAPCFLGFQDQFQHAYSSSVYYSQF